MNTLTLKQFRYFDALAQHGHFGRAAEAAAISQPALSLQIKALEDALGAPLFERGTRHVRLTAIGEEVASRVRRILRSVDELGDFVRAAQRLVLGRLRLGIIPTVAPYLLPRILATLMRHHPALDLHLRETITPHLLKALSDGHLDAALVALPIREPGIEEVALFSEAFVLVRPSAMGGDPVPSPERLRAMRLLLLEEGHCFRDQALAFCQRAEGVSPRELLDGSTLSTLVQLVGAGIGVTLIPEMAVPVEARSAHVAISHFPAPEPERQIGLIWRRASPLTPQLEALAAAVREAAGIGGAGIEWAGLLTPGHQETAVPRWPRQGA